MRTGSVWQCCWDGENTTKCPFSVTLKNYCNQRTEGQQEQQGTDLKGSLQWHCAAFPQTHKPDSSCLLQHPPLLSPPCAFAMLHTNWSPEYSHYSKTIWALREQNLRHRICTSKTSQPQHLQGQEREQAEQRWQWGRLFSCTEGAPHRDLYHSIYRSGRLQFFWAFIIPAQHQPGFTSPPPSPCNPSQYPNKVSAKRWCQTESCRHKGVVFVFLFCSSSLHYPQQPEYSDRSDNRNWCFQYVLKDNCQKREDSSFQMPRDAHIFFAFPELPWPFLSSSSTQLQKILVQVLIPYPWPLIRNSPLQSL